MISSTLTICIVFIDLHAPSICKIVTIMGVASGTIVPKLHLASGNLRLLKAVNCENAKTEDTHTHTLILVLVYA